jgi:hypothetical protein
MSRTQYYCAASLDGYIAEADDTLDWLLTYVRIVNAGVPELYDEMVAAAGERNLWVVWRRQRGLAVRRRGTSGRGARDGGPGRARVASRSSTVPCREGRCS